MKIPFLYVVSVLCIIIIREIAKDRFDLSGFFGGSLLIIFPLNLTCIYYV